MAKNVERVNNLIWDTLHTDILQQTQHLGKFQHHTHGRNY